MLRRRLLLIMMALPFVVVPRLSAECSMTGGVSHLTAKTFQVGVAATIPKSGNVETCELPFSLPVAGRVAKLQGTAHFRAECAGDTLAGIGSDAGQYPMKNELANAGGVSTVVVDYEIPIPSSKNGSVSLQAIVGTACANSGDWEFQGLLNFQ
jgi:hypothetical protein